jgi:membrane peptidoglycan carboxypeptidase
LHVDPTPFRVVKDSFGSVVLDDQYPQANDVVSAGTAYLVTSMLEDVINHGTGYPNAIIGRPAAGKTGTTSDFRDAWFVGFTPDLVTAVWLGNDDYKPMNESYGGDIPARIWARFMKAALQGTPPHDFTVPADQVAKVASCHGGQDYFLKGTEPVACGRGAEDAAIPPAYSDNYTPASLPPEPTVPPEANPPPNSIGDGQHYQVLDTPGPSANPESGATAPAAAQVVTPPPGPAAAASAPPASAAPPRR